MIERALINLIGGPFCGQVFTGPITQDELVINEVDIMSGQRRIHAYALKEKTEHADKNKIPVYKFYYDQEKSRELSEK